MSADFAQIILSLKIMQNNMRESTQEKNHGNVTNVEKISSTETGGRIMYENVQEAILSPVKSMDNSNAHSVIRYLRKPRDLKNTHKPGIRDLRKENANKI